MIFKFLLPFFSKLVTNCSILVYMSLSVSQNPCCTYCMATVCASVCSWFFFEVFLKWWWWWWVGGEEWWVTSIICQRYFRVLGAIFHSSNPCSMAALVDCYFIFLVEGVLYEKCILKRVLNLLICIHLYFLSPFFLMDWVYCSQKNGMFSVYVVPENTDV